MSHIMVYGNPSDGFRFVGPFETEGQARRYCAGEPGNAWVAELDAPASMDITRKPPLVALAEAFDAQWNAISGLEPESVVERRLYNAICVAIGLPPRCEIEEDFVHPLIGPVLDEEPTTGFLRAPPGYNQARLGDEIAEQERSMEAANASAERLLSNTPTAVDDYAAWLARQPKPKTMAEALAQLPPGVTGSMMDPDKPEVVHNLIAEALEDTQGLLAAMLLETRPAEEIEDQMVKNRAVLLTQAEIDKAMAGPQKPKGGSGDQR